MNFDRYSYIVSLMLYGNSPQNAFLIPEEAFHHTASITELPTAQYHYLPHSSCVSYSFNIGIIMVPGTSGDTQIWIGWGCAADRSRLIPMFRGNFSKNGYPYFKVV